MAETVVLFCILYCGKLVTKCVSDSLAQTTLKISDSLAQIHIKKFPVKHHGGMTYCKVFVKSY